MQVIYDATKGAETVTAQLKELGNINQRYVTNAARKGAILVYDAVLATAPVGETYNLIDAIIMKPEKSRYNGKKVYWIGFDPKANSVLQKPIKHPGVFGGKKTYAYYPASVEYGFNIGDGAEYLSRSQRFLRGSFSTYPHRKTDGKFYMSAGFALAVEDAKNVMEDYLREKVEKVWNEANGK